MMNIKTKIWDPRSTLVWGSTMKTLDSGSVNNYSQQDVPYLGRERIEQQLVYQRVFKLSNPNEFTSVFSLDSSL